MTTEQKQRKELIHLERIASAIAKLIKESGMSKNTITQVITELTNEKLSEKQTEEYPIWLAYWDIYKDFYENKKNGNR